VHGHARDRRIVDAEIVSAPTKTFALPMPTERSPLTRPRASRGRVVTRHRDNGV